MPTAPTATLPAPVGVLPVAAIGPPAWSLSPLPLGGVPLDRLATGTPARVVRVDAPGSLGDRLVELGLTPGAAVAVLRRAPFGGPLQLRVREFVLSIQRHTAAGIAVLPDAA